mgnify:CR=1 FL=1|tara:strand:- start:2404 stop:2751 length:348 start_codon:yes stop_codon:yes gene_type:complete
MKDFVNLMVKNKKTINVKKNKLKGLKYRNSAQIVCDLLEETSFDQSGVRITRLCTKVNMPYTRTKKLIRNLTSAGVINEIKINGLNTYIITEKGRLLLSEYKKYNDLAESFGLVL